MPNLWLQTQLTCKTLDLRVVSALSQAAELSVQATHLLPQAVQLHTHICRLVCLQPSAKECKGDNGKRAVAVLSHVKGINTIASSS